MDENLTYQNPLVTRYASKEMSKIFSDTTRVKLWRQLWIALAMSEKELGLNITQEQIDEMLKFKDDIDFEEAKKIEHEVRHDVMAHVHAFGKQAKSAMPIIHLGATSCFVTDNAEVLMINSALNLVRDKLVCVLDRLKGFALKYKAVPTLGFTHLQPAQLTTVGKRASLWMQDLVMDYESLNHLLSQVKLRGVKGTTGTQASFLALFDNDHEKVKRLEGLLAEKMGLKKAYSVTGQTYPRKFDYNVLSVLSQIAQSASKFANDLRILQSMKEIEEPFEKSQIGSSAMAYKRNPMRSERVCSLARFVISLPLNHAMTASTQWLERTLDDSANKRITTAQGFLAIDGILNLYMNITEGLVVYEKMIQAHINQELPFMATENILMECVKNGADRQVYHDKIKNLSMQSAFRVKNDGQENDLIERIKQDESFACVHDSLDKILEAKNFIGRADVQVEEFIKNDVDPILQDNKSALKIKAEILL